MGFMRSAQRQLGAQWSEHHYDSIFNGDVYSKNASILVQPVDRAVDAVIASIHRGSIDKGFVAGLVFRQNASGINEGAKGAGVVIVNPCRVIKESKDYLRASHLALLAPDADHNLPSEPCGESHRGSWPICAKRVRRY